ncbi:MAG TPA: hypothetical protein VLL54_14775 [Pyrinomonadaceae bacterium]|nr:hypothetical protein [Pyrinomonadaceae bacterium]
MQQPNYFYYLFAARWPMHLIALIGIIVAIVRWQRHPRVSLLAIFGLLLYMGQSLTFGTIFYLLPRLHQQQYSYSTVNYVYIVVEICRDIVFTGVVVLLVSAAFSARHAGEPTGPPAPA